MGFEHLDSACTEMDRRRSARLLTAQPMKLGISHASSTPVARPKRGKTSRPTKQIARSDTRNAEQQLETPRKRRKITSNEASQHLVTPTPALAGVMLGNTPVIHSTGDIDDAHSNAPLQTSESRQVVPNYTEVEDASLSKSRHESSDKAAATTKTILEQAKAHLLHVDSLFRPESDLRAAIAQHHCRMFDAEGLAEPVDPFRSLASGIMAQQVSGAAASSIKAKFVNLFPATKSHKGPPHFPPPALVAETPLTTLRGAGLSQRKAEYIQGLAEQFAAGQLTAKMLAKASDEEVMQKLVAVRGLGQWSVEMFCCFGLKRMDVFSTGDLGVQRGMTAYMGRNVSKLKVKGGGKWKYMSEREMLDIAAKFSPYRSLFMWYMWRIESVQGSKGTDVGVMQKDA